MTNVSVVIPTYNAAATIERALRSIQLQSCRPFEVILVDDFSTDKTLEVARRHPVFRDLEVRVHLQNRNLGAASARNAGWDLARGEFVAFLDADDAWHADKLKRQISIMDTGTAISGHRTPMLRSELELIRPVTDNLTVRHLRTRDVLLKNPFHTSSVMVRRNIPLRFSQALHRAEDYLLWCEVVLRGYRGVEIGPPLAFVFKPFYGHAGLSANLWAMQQGELAAYDSLYDMQLLSRPTQLGLKAWSQLRYCRRVVLSQLRARSTR